MSSNQILALFVDMYFKNGSLETWRKNVYVVFRIALARQYIHSAMDNKSGLIDNASSSSSEL